MLTSFDQAEYDRRLRQKRRGGVDLHRHYGQCMHKLVAHWARKLAPHQTLILLFVLDRTVYHGKLSETITFDQFLTGMGRKDSDEMIFSGLNMSKNTLNLHIKDLLKDGFLYAYACVGTDGRTEIKPRLYAINCKKLFNLDIADEEDPMILREPKAKRAVGQEENEQESAPRAARNLLKTPKKVGSEAPKYSPPNLGDIYTNHRITKVIPIGAPSAAEPDGKVDVATVMANARAQREQQRQQRAANRPTKRTAPRTAGPYSIKAIQDLIDATMARYNAGLPRMIVNAKALGVLRKRMELAEVDRDQFLDWVIKFWQTTADAHGRAARRNIAERTTPSYKPIPLAPDFNTLAYRLPYFLTCYRSFLQAERAGLATTREAQLESKIEKLQRTVASVKDEARSAQERERNLRQRLRTPPPRRDDDTPTTPVKRIARPTRATVDPLLEDDLPPAWDEFATTSNKKAQR